MKQSGKVAFEEYVSDAHKDFIDSNGSTSWTAGNDVYAQVNALMAANNPYQGVALYDPSLDLDALDDRVGEFINFVDAIDESTQWEGVLATARANISDLVDYTSILSTHIAEWESHIGSANTQVNTVLPDGDLIGAQATEWSAHATQADTTVDSILPSSDLIGLQTTEWEALVTSVLSKIDSITPLIVATQADNQTDIWEDMVTAVLAKISSLMPSNAEVEALVDAFEAKARMNLARGYARAQAAAFDGNAAVGTMLPNYLAMLEAEFSADVAKFSAEAYLQNQRDRTQLILTSIDEMSKILSVRLQSEHERLVVIMQALDSMTKLLMAKASANLDKTRLKLGATENMDQLLVAKAQANTARAQLVLQASEQVGRVLNSRLQENLNKTQLETTSIAQSIGLMTQMFAQHGAWVGTSAQLQERASTIRIAATNDKISGDMALNTDEALWYLKVLKEAWPVVAAPAGLPGVSNPAPTKGQQWTSQIMALGSLAIPLVMAVV